jgi:hypothetical protein
MKEFAVLKGSLRYSLASNGPSISNSPMAPMGTSCSKLEGLTTQVLAVIPRPMFEASELCWTLWHVE